MNADVYSITGKKISTAVLPASVFEQPAHESLLAQAVRVYLSNQRQGTKAVKTRADVTYSTHKIWKQKGTGHARHGSRKAPIFVGGGVSHGPSGIENYTLKLTKKMRQRALLGALSQKAKDQAVRLVEDLALFDGKTKSMEKFLIAAAGYPKGRTLLVLDAPIKTLLKAAQNLKNVTPTQAARLNTYEVLNYPVIIMTQKAVAYLAKRQEGDKPVPAVVIEAKKKVAAKKATK